MRRDFNRVHSLFLLCILAASLLGAADRTRAAPPQVLPPMTADRLTALRLAGIAGDRSQIPTLIAALESPDAGVETTALHALAQMGATEALPEVESLVKWPPNAWTENYARAAHARLIAEAAPQKRPAFARLQAKIITFLTVINFRPTEITAALAVQRRQFPRPLGATFPVCVCEEIADMIYRSGLQYTRPLPALRGLDFGMDPAALLKIRLSRMPKRQRLPWLIDQISKSQVSGMGELRLVQLAADEGRPASRAAAAKLKEIRLHRSRYPFPGFAGLFDVIRSAGDPAQAALVRSFTQDRDGWVAFVAQDSLPSIKRGQREQVMTGY